MTCPVSPRPGSPGSPGPISGTILTSQSHGSAPLWCPGSSGLPSPSRLLLWGLGVAMAGVPRPCHGSPLPRAGVCPSTAPVAPHTSAINTHQDTWARSSRGIQPGLESPGSPACPVRLGIASSARTAAPAVSPPPLAPGWPCGKGLLSHPTAQRDLLTGGSSPTPSSVSAGPPENPFLLLRPHSLCPAPVAEAAETEIAEGKAAIRKQEQGGEVAQPWELQVQGKVSAGKWGAPNPTRGWAVIHSSQGSRKLPFPRIPGREPRHPSPPSLSLRSGWHLLHKDPCPRAPRSPGQPQALCHHPRLCSCPKSLYPPSNGAAQAPGVALLLLQPGQGRGSRSPSDTGHAVQAQGV